MSNVAEVKIQEGESIESALRRFKRKVQQEDIIKDIKKHSFYLKPGDKRRAKQALARKRSRKKQRREVGLARSFPTAPAATELRPPRLSVRLWRASLSNGQAAHRLATDIRRAAQGVWHADRGTGRRQRDDSRPEGQDHAGEGDEALKDKINSLIQQDRKRILLNLADVPYIDSAGLGEVVRTYTTVSRQGGQLKLVNLTKRITDLLSITKLLTVFETFDSEPKR